TDDNVTYNSATTLTGNVLVDTGAGAGTIQFASTLDGTVADTETLGLTAGTGNVSFSNTVGAGTALGDIQIVSDGGLTVSALLTAKSFTETAGTGVTNLNSITTTGAANSGGGAVNVISTGAITAGTITTNGGVSTGVGRAAGAVTLNSGSVLTAGAINAVGSAAGGASGLAGGVGGAVSLTGTARVDLGGNIVTTGGLGDPAPGTTNQGIDGDVAVQSGGNVTILGSVTGNVTSRAGGATVFGATTFGGYLDVTAGGDITQQTGPLSVTGNLWAKTTGGNIVLDTFNNHLVGAVSLIAPLSNGVTGAGNSVALKADHIRVGLDRPTGGSESGITAARVTIETALSSSIDYNIPVTRATGLITADEPFDIGTSPALTIIADGVVGNPATANPASEGLWVMTNGLVKVVTDALSGGTVMLFGDEAFQPKYEFSGDPLHRSVKYNGVEATNAQLTGALDAAYLDIRNQTTEIRESGFAKENASKVLRRGVVTSAGPGQPAVDDSTGLASMELCDGTFGNSTLACQ
ncbi:MAG: hypothetical protein U1A72_09380, partial [Sulfuritalea sp.]|nr:hypothetical protein [Sulfuritalea sp.]